jgi:hypothetical protein
MRPFLAAAVGLALAAQPSGDRWWKHIEYLASDKLEGRDTGSAGHRLAAEYVAEQFAALGLRPAGEKGWFQPVPFDTTRLDESASSLSLWVDGKETKLTLGKEAILGARASTAESLRAPLVFIGRGLQAPERDYDDLKGIDLKGKIAVFLTGAPKSWPGPMAAHLQNGEIRWESLRRAGAVGVVTLLKSEPMPWTRMAAMRFEKSMTARIPGAQTDGPRVSVNFNRQFANLLFEGTGHTFEELVKLADGDGPLPRFPLNKELASVAKVERGTIESQNVAAVLPGRTKEHVVLTAHLDHTGIARSMAEDKINNGAMDNASGVAAVLELARRLKEAGPLERSVLFLLVTGEEKGLQGSRYFTRRPTVPVKQMAANLNLDMFLPLFDLKTLIYFGGDESTLGDAARDVGGEFRIAAAPDPMPDQVIFIRSDQYNFVLQGVPSLMFLFGYEKGSPEEKIQQEWFQSRYHSVTDDAAQPVDKQGAEKFLDYMTALTKRVANDKTKPAWKSDSYFRRFAR